MNDIIVEMILLVQESLCNLRNEIKNPRIGPIEDDRGTILFEFRNQTFKASEPTISVFGLDNKIDKSIALRMLLDKKTIPVYKKNT